MDGGVVGLVLAMSPYSIFATLVHGAASVTKGGEPPFAADSANGSYAQIATFAKSGCSSLIAVANGPLRSFMSHAVNGRFEHIVTNAEASTPSPEGRIPDFRCTCVLHFV